MQHFKKRRTLNEEEVRRYYSARLPALRLHAGGEWRGCCPIHGGRNPTAFTVNITTGEWFCHSECKDGGTIWSLEERLSGGGFQVATDNIYKTVCLSSPDFAYESDRYNQSIAREAWLHYQAVQNGSKGDAGLPPIERVHTYTDESLKPIYEVRIHRYPNGKKACLQYRIDGDGVAYPGLRGMQPVIYNWPYIRNCDQSETVFITEGERKADLMMDIGFASTTNPGGAGKWRAEFSEPLVGRDVIITADRNVAGYRHAEIVARNLVGIASRVRIWSPPVQNGLDVADWIDEMRDCGDDNDAITKKISFHVGRNSIEIMSHELIDECIARLVESSPVKPEQLEDDDEEIGEYERGEAEYQFDEASSILGQHDLLERFVLLYPKQLLFDKDQRKILTVEEFKLYFGAQSKALLIHPGRKVLPMERVIFNPSGTPDGCLNLFAGFDIEADDMPCDLIVDHIAMICNGDADLIHWMTSWMAIQVQQPGIKLNTSIVVHGVQGSGKSALWEFIFARVMSPYAAIIGQDEMTSRFNGWLSRKLFVGFDEVSASSRLNAAKMKRYITSEMHSIEEKGRDARPEDNRTNFVFMSNNVDPVIIDPDDRRYTVIRIQNKQPKDYYTALMNQALNDGGISGFKKYLMDYNLAGFNRHTDAFENQDKIDVSNATQNTYEAFYALWSSGTLSFPYCACLSVDLYRAYKAWTKTHHDEKPVSHQKFGAYLAGKPKLTRDRKEVNGRLATIYTPTDVKSIKGDEGIFSKRVDEFEKKYARSGLFR